MGGCYWSTSFEERLERQRSQDNHHEHQKHDERGERVQEWTNHYLDMKDYQVHALNHDFKVKRILRTENLKVIKQNWTDVVQKSTKTPKQDSNNPNDVQFFAIPPESSRPKGGGPFVCFPAMRCPFASDKDFMTTSQLEFNVRDRSGKQMRLTLRDFLANIGLFISDLPQDTDWSDPVDGFFTPITNTITVLPSMRGQVDTGIAAFNDGPAPNYFHIIIDGVSGDIGWATEQPGNTALFFRDAGNSLRALTMTGERPNYTSPMEYDDGYDEGEECELDLLQPLIYHIQIEMKPPKSTKERARKDYLAHAHAPKRKVTNSLKPYQVSNFKSARSSIEIRRKEQKSWGRVPHGSPRYAKGVESKPLENGRRSISDNAKAKRGLVREATPYYARRSISKSAAEIAHLSSGETNAPKVVMGAELGEASVLEQVPRGRDGRCATRTPGKRVRVTKMYFDLDRKGEIAASHLERFCRHVQRVREETMKNANRTTGIQSWGEVHREPVKCATLPHSANEIALMFAQYPKMAGLQLHQPKRDLIMIGRIRALEDHEVTTLYALDDLIEVRRIGHDYFCRKISKRKEVPAPAVRHQPFLPGDLTLYE